MSDYEEHVALLRRWCEAYPVDIFPVPPEELRARNAVAADVLREVALPQFARDADAIESLSAEVARLRAERDAALEALTEIAEQQNSHAGWFGCRWCALDPRNGHQATCPTAVARAALSSGGAQ